MKDEWVNRRPAQPIGARVAEATYRGEGGVPVVEQATLDIRAGSFVCITGESGSGKTTLTRVMAGDLRPTSGDVLLDDVSTTSMSRRRLHDAFSYVGADSSVLNITIRDILLLASPHAKDGELWNALSCASFAEEARALPDELGTLIGERGMKLSGGQRQRLLLARALLLDRSAMLLDEATSQVDPRADLEIPELSQAAAWYEDGDHDRASPRLRQSRGSHRRA